MTWPPPRACVGSAGTPTASVPIGRGSSRSRTTASLGEPTTLVRDAHRSGLVVHPYTFREENSELPTDFRQGNPDAPGYAGAMGDIPGMLELFYDLGIDGLFCDSPDVCVSVREEVADPRG